MSVSTHPEILWAQRSSESDAEKNIVYLTINLPELIESTLEFDLQPTGISFKAKAGSPNEPQREYSFKLDFFDDIVPEESSKRLSTRHLALVLRKKEKKAEYWPRLTKDKAKLPFVRTDFSKWVDEDEQDGEPIKDDDMDGMMGGMPGMGGMGGMPGMGGMGGMPGMGGMGGMPGMGGMGGMPGMGGMGGMDFEKMMAQMGEAGGAGAPGLDDDEGPSGAGGGNDDSDDDGPPPLESATEETKP